MSIDERYNLLVVEARRWIGTKEIGNNSGEIVTMFQNWDNSPDHWPWCMAFVQYCLKQVDILYGELGQLCTEHSLKRSEHVMTVWNRSPKRCRRTSPKPGYIAIWRHYKNGKATSSGHTGIVTGANIKHGVFSTIEGNTSDSANVEREGEGVYSKVRSLNPKGSMKLVGFLDPWA